MKYLVFVRFHFFSCLVNWRIFNRLLDAFFNSFGGTWNSLFLIFEGLGSRYEIRGFSRDTLEGPRLREPRQVVVKPRSVGAVTFIQYCLRSLKDTGYSIQER